MWSDRRVLPICSNVVDGVSPCDCGGWCRCIIVDSDSLCHAYPVLAVPRLPRHFVVVATFAQSSASAEEKIWLPDYWVYKVNKLGMNQNVQIRRKFLVRGAIAQFMFMLCALVALRFKAVFGEERPHCVCLTCDRAH